MIELAPGWLIEVEDSTPNHWVGSCRDLVIAFAYPGSHNDLRHVQAIARCIERLGKNSKNGVRILFVLPPLHAKPPDEKVRRALVDEIRKSAAQIAIVVTVVEGTGFGVAIHRGVLTGILAMVRPKFRLVVEGSVRAGLSLLLDSKSAVFQPLLRYCEDRLTGPS
ncbi:MAG TPA: hypothetical protein PLW65_13780 [Pseudomonadota bacterium]|nr:hypothetical protein [Pseudomonadota bacterium]